MKRIFTCLLLILLNNALCIVPAYSSSLVTFIRKLEARSTAGKAAMRSMRRAAHFAKDHPYDAAFETENMTAVALSTRRHDGHFIAIESAEVRNNGDVVMYKYNLPQTNAVPFKFEYEEPNLEDLMNPHEFSQVTTIRQTFSEPFKGDVLYQADDIAVKEINGKHYRMIWNTWVQGRGGVVSQASVYHVDPSGREIFHSQILPGPKGAIRAASFKLPEEIKGQVVTVHLNKSADRLIFVTSEGEQYTYAIKKKEGPITDKFDAFTFTQVAKEPVKGGVESFLAKVAVFPAKKPITTVEATRGLQIHTKTLDKNKGPYLVK